MSLFNEEDFVLPLNALPVDEEFFAENNIDTNGAFAYRVVGSAIEWWVRWIHPVTGRVYVEERIRIPNE